MNAKKSFTLRTMLSVWIIGWKFNCSASRKRVGHRTTEGLSLVGDHVDCVLQALEQHLDEPRCCAESFVPVGD